MARGNAQQLSDLIDDTNKSKRTTFSSEHIQDLINASGAEETVYLLTVSDTAPVVFQENDKYYSANTKLIYTATSSTAFNNGENPKKNILYIDQKHNTILVWNGTKMVSYGGGGSTTNISDESNNAIKQKDDGIYVKDLSDEVKKINIAQKTVNELGYKSLLDNPSEIFTLNSSSATSSGEGTNTVISKAIKLNDSIENYNFLKILLEVKNDARSINWVPFTNELRVSDINYHNSDTNTNAGSAIFLLIGGVDTTTPGSSMVGHVTLKCWFRDSTTLFVYRGGMTNLLGVNWSKWRIKDVIGIKKEVITIDPMNYIDTTQGIEDTPVGHVMSIMGNNAPAHYLKCDGTVYNKTDYPYLFEYFKREFGRANKFGGDGTDTFAVPDLRGEFLRGSNLGDTAKVGASVGEHQEPTIEPNEFINTSSNWLCKYYDKNGGNVNTLNPDKTYPEGIAQSDIGAFYMLNDNVYNPSVSSTQHSTRPTNTSVLYVIKYEPTYFIGSINGYEETETISTPTFVDLPSGDDLAIVVSTTIPLSKAITQYDKIRVRMAVINTDTTDDFYPNFIEIPVSDISYLSAVGTGRNKGLYSLTTSTITPTEEHKVNMTFLFKDANTLIVHRIAYQVTSKSWKKIKIEISGIKNRFDIGN